MKIRKTTIDDLDTIEIIYQHARTFMVQTGNPHQWGDTQWPPMSLIRHDIENGKSYVCENDGKVVGTFFFDVGENVEETYLDIDGKWIGDDTYGVIHRIANDHSIKGIGRYCIEWAFAQCGHLRMDTHDDNKVMQHVLEKAGFVKCGIIYVHEDHDPRIAYEKIR